jgi:aryl-alcohol dehydrogenase-like predicted oxidoreductase
MPTPDTIKLGDVEVPRIGLGTNRLANTPANVAFIRDAVAAGLRHIDTAHLYASGESEQTIGAALADDRPDGLVVATKGGYHDGSPENISAEIEQSLRRLQTDCIDLYYLHKPQPDVALEKSLEAIAAARDRGQIRDVGVSNVDVTELKRARSVTEIAAVQNHYNLSHREHDDVVDYCEEEGIPFVAYFPLRDRGSASTAEAITALLDRSPVMLPIPGTLSIGHLRENLAALQRVGLEAEHRGDRAVQLDGAVVVDGDDLRVLTDRGSDGVVDDVVVTLELRPVDRARVAVGGHEAALRADDARAGEPLLVEQDLDATLVEAAEHFIEPGRGPLARADGVLETLERPALLVGLVLGHQRVGGGENFVG